MLKPVVLDASVAAGWLLPDEQAPLELMKMMAETTAFVPAIFRTEVCDLMNMAVRRSRIDLAFAVAQMDALGSVSLQVAAELGADIVLKLAVKHSLTAYDATYLALALDKAATLATRDMTLRGAAVAEGLETTTG
ncbi:MAG: type II toxin-antitoxin system VapC family toxin [Rhizobiaceae bacterium]